ALALLGDPQLLILDEPANGLDPAGVIELRDLLRQLVASRGITVLLSSHMLLEVEQVASHVAIIAQGQLRFQGSLDGFRARNGRRLQVSVADAETAAACLQAHGWHAVHRGDGVLSVPVGGDGDSAAINALLVRRGFAVSRLSEERPALESLFLQSVEAAPA
ncbi:MAG TPA: hypothetical protein VN515_00115, partial [Terriglobales bacterium]|nr:hypothetical protein [Terriglobales bacterium]